MENTDYLDFVEATKEKYLEKIDSIEEIDKANGASAMSCTLVGGAIAASIALCPTTKCSNQCGKRN